MAFSIVEQKLVKQINDEKLRLSLAMIRRGMEQIWSADVPRIIQDYTDHGINHCERLAGYAWQILQANKGESLSDLEMYILLASIYLHDIGMQCDVQKFPAIKTRAIKLGASFDIEFKAERANDYSLEEQKAIRQNHHYLSSAWVAVAADDRDNILNQAVQTIPRQAIRDLMDVCLHHTKLLIKNCKLTFNADPNGRKRFVAALLRFADELDITSTRVSQVEVIQSFTLKADNVLYWWLHNRTDISFDKNIPNRITVKIRLHPEDATAFGPFIYETFIKGFNSKNEPVINVLSRNNITLIITDDSGIFKDEFEILIPSDIQAVIEEMKRNGLTNKAGDENATESKRPIPEPGSTINSQNPQYLRDIEDRIQLERTLLFRYEEELSYETDPRRIAGIEANIERQKQSLARYQQEAAELGANIALPELVVVKEPVVDEEQLEYVAEEQAWYPASLPALDEVGPEQLERFQKEVDVVLMVATEVELRAALHRLQPYPRRKRVLRAYVGAETYYLGRFGVYRTAVTRSGMGSSGERGSTLATPEAIRTWQPKAIIMPGIAFGKSPAKQKMADVLVASQIIPYENQRKGEETIFRSAIPASNALLQNRFENALDWYFERPDSKRCRLLIGPILSGEKLVDNPEFKAFLFRHFPEAIGGEMEGAGLAGAAGRDGVPWILVKAICDWGDGKKHGKHQPLAAAAAVSLVHHVLSQSKVFQFKIPTYETRIAQESVTKLSKKQQMPKRNFIANVPYGLESKLYGREQEIGLLDDWFYNDRAHPLLALIGLGGQGKSALAWQWQKQLQTAKHAPPLVVWWSFYEQDSTVNRFADQILRHFQDKPEEYGSLRIKVDRVVKHFQQTSVLILLDGAERLLRAYSSLGASYQGDEIGDHSNATSQEWKQLHQCIDPAAGILLQWLAEPELTQAKTLVTSRLFPQELAGRGGLGLQGVRRHNLVGLNNDSAYALFRSLEIKTTRAEVQAACEPLGYHPLSLYLLARAVRYSPAIPNDLRAVADYDSNSDLFSKQEYVLQQAYNNLPRRAQYTLSHLAAFRSSVAWQVLSDVFGEDKAVLEDLYVLEERGLLTRTMRQVSGERSSTGQMNTIYDLHPIVRRYAYDRLTNREATHDQLAIYFKSVMNLRHIGSLEDLSQAIELYHHLTRAGHYDEAYELLRDQFVTPLYLQLGAYQILIELLLALFPHGADKLPGLSKEDAQGWTLSVLANSYSGVGRPSVAVFLDKQYITISEKRHDKENQAIGLANLAERHHKLGKLKVATHNLSRSISLCREIEDRYWEAVGHQVHGRLLANTGRWPEAMQEFDTALVLARAENEIENQSLTWIYRAQAALLHGKAERGLSAAQEALKLADETARTRYPHERDYVWVYWLLGWAWLQVGNLSSAQSHLDEALRRCRTINLVDLEPAILLAQARLAVAQKQLPLAQSLVGEAQHIAGWAGYVLDLADIHNFRAQLALDAGDREEAQQLAQQAHDFAWCDGPPYAYQSALDEAQRLLALAKG